MGMRAAEIAALVPLGEVDIEAFLAVAIQLDAIRRRLVEWVAPLDLVRLDEGWFDSSVYS
jgi:hypothetical protein